MTAEQGIYRNIIAKGVSLCLKIHTQTKVVAAEPLSARGTTKSLSVWNTARPYETSQDPYTTTPPYGYGQQQQHTMTILPHRRRQHPSIGTGYKGATPPVP